MANQQPNRQGPWDVPLRAYVQSLAIVVTIWNLQGDCIEQEFHLDYGNNDDRKFLGRVSFWAISNGRSVETLSKADWEKTK